MSATGSEPEKPGIGALIARRRTEILAGLLACDPVGTPDPDETPEAITELLLEWEARKAFGWERTIPHEEAMRILLAPTLRWEAYQAGPATLDAEERERLEAAGALVQKEFGLGPEARVQAPEAAGKGARLADVIAILVLQRELWAMVTPG